MAWVNLVTRRDCIRYGPTVSGALDMRKAPWSEEEQASLAGLFTFNVYQRIFDEIDNDGERNSVMLPAFSDTASQQAIRETSSIPILVDLLANTHSSDGDVSERATAALALRSCLECEPSVRHSIRAGIVPAALDMLRQSESAMPLHVCGVLLLNSLSIHHVGQVAMMAEEGGVALRDSLARMLLKSDFPPAVVDAGVETAFNLSSSPKGCDLINSTHGIPERLAQLSKSTGGVDNTMSTRAQATCDRLRMKW